MLRSRVGIETKSFANNKLLNRTNKQTSIKFLEAKTEVIAITIKN